MSELVNRATTTPVDRAWAIAERMSREVAIMGERLACLIARSPTAQEGTLAQGHAFLHAMFEAYAGEIVSAVSTQGTSTRGDAAVHPVDRLVERLSLTSSEIDLIVLAAMADEHEGYASTLRTLNPRNEPHATVGLAAQLGCENRRERFVFRRTLEQGAAVTSGVITLGGDAPFWEKNLLLADGLWPVLWGVEVCQTASRSIPLTACASGLDQWLGSREVDSARRALQLAEARVILVIADTETAAVNRAAVLVMASGRRWAAFDFATNTPPGTERPALVRSLALDAIPIFKLIPSETSAPVAMPDIENFPGPVILCARGGTVASVGDMPVMMLKAHTLPVLAREQLWRETLPELADHAPTLASRYAVEPAAAAALARDLRAHAALNGDTIDLQSVAQCVSVRSYLPLSAGVRLVRPIAQWDQLVLPFDRKALLVEALNRLLHQGTVLDRWKFLEGRPGARGVRILFSGPPGTGKTLSAEVMAHDLGVDLMVVDISRVVSKWIGETEKHLAQAFDAAEQVHAVLLFDEADALFGKRTEISDAHDRYANLETAYLLARLERFDGLAILATNLKQNIDPAFLRRLEFVVDFDEPSAAEREALWRCHLPAQAPLDDDVDLKELAALYPIVGGLIRNASVAAGFLAAAGRSSIGRNHLIGAVLREYEKSGKAFPGMPAGVLPV
jgi:ATPase family associated with various cellular activities (AAA)/Winged helix domain, variant